ncbi:hypothetical protein M431DRAFT_271780 [Trichoderma harzianum CBS 226.95]|uniref:Uncharacterized protein n=1 Tax=Trichoderma harzianum CBS 226.95 TaxID=983964 RepID=A0A2T3ZXV6_TRIHA|nr:hypothetical protein M431DRAFT_271780 [Trichoderma harzianum CBS 226.95]PTB49650.1 hypothetical protein M431DRAFT_271780 [Trichoderma harzianum CBS 226.95]
MICGGWIGAIKERLEAFFIIITFCSMGNNGGRFISFSHFAFFFFLHCIMACRQMHARYIPEPSECLYVLFFYNLFFRLYFVFATNLAGT